MKWSFLTKATFTLDHKIGTTWAKSEFCSGKYSLIRFEAPTETSERRGHTSTSDFRLLPTDTYLSVASYRSDLVAIYRVLLYTSQSLHEIT